MLKSIFEAAKIILPFLPIFAGLWVFTKYIIEKASLPSAELDIECKKIGFKGTSQIIEIITVIKNKGSTVLLVHDLKIKLKAILSEEDKINNYPDDKKFGRLKFNNYLTDNKSLKKSPKNKGLIPLVPDSTFVMPNVSQKYTYTTSINNSVEYIFAHVQFSYHSKNNYMRAIVISIGHFFGLIRIRLKNIKNPHTAQRVFELNKSDNPKENASVQNSKIKSKL